MAHEIGHNDAANSGETHPDSFRVEGETKSSQLVLDAIADAETEFEPYWKTCDDIDKIYSASRDLRLDDQFFADQEFDLFWSSLEIMKPATYCKPPEPAVAPRFQNRDKRATTASELVERCVSSGFDRDDLDAVMLECRDDLLLAGRGVIRVRYEDGDGGKRVCQDHMDRRDFLHEPARKWKEVGWVGFASYLSKDEYKKRFPGKPEGEFNVRRNREDRHRVDTAAKCKVWEVWHRSDNRVYWVTKGVTEFLDESKPFLDLEGFFPCPRPAYGTIKRRTLIPAPDYGRYEYQLNEINELTRRIHTLLEWVKVKGLIPAGGDVAAAVEAAFDQSSDDVLLIPVPGAGLMQGSGQFVQFLPLKEFAETIQGLIEARRELINNFYELSGISDIMRGATEEDETYGAQKLKQQNGSVRIREKVDELQRLARDTTRIAGEIVAEKFGQDDLLDMSQMDIPTKAELKKQGKELEEAARKEMEALEKQARDMADQAQQGNQQVDPQQAEQQFQQAQQAILAKYQPQIDDLAKQVPIEDIMELLRDQRMRAFTIEIETDSTIMTDEMAEKEQRGEFMQAFSQTVQSVQPLLMAGEPGAKLAGGMLKFALQPFRVGRELDGMIDDFVEAAPQMIAQQGGDEEKAMAEANQKLAEAELQKAQASIAKVQADAEAKMQDTRQKAHEAERKAEADQQRIQLEMQDTQGKIAETSARIEKIYADIQLAHQKLGLEANKEQREDVKAAADIQMQETDRAMQAQDAERDAEFRAEEGERADRQQEFTERQGERGEDRADRQQEFAEREAERENDADR